MDINIDIKIKIDDTTEIKLNYIDGLKLYNELRKIYGQKLNEIASNAINSNIGISIKDDPHNNIYGPIKWKNPFWITSTILPTSFTSTTDIKENIKEWMNIL